ncbi:MAG: lamin tail domain-containing protein [Caldilinea sp.]
MCLPSIFLLLIVPLLFQCLPVASLTAQGADDTLVVEMVDGVVVINEIHYDPSPASARFEFIELYNPGETAVNLSGWALTGGVDFEFPAGTLLPASGLLVVAADPALIERTYGIRSLGPFSGRLSNDGDSVAIRNHRAQEVDRVEYGVGFPWPVVGYQVERSINLLNRTADNALGGAWRAAAPTPGQSNAGVVANLPPIIQSVEHTPKAPTVRDTISVRARVADEDGVSGVTLWVQVVTPGAYIRITDPAYATQWTAYAMQSAGDDFYMANLPAEIVHNRYLIRYRVEATDRGGRSVMAPLLDDPQPNFALFVNDGPVLWAGAVNPHQATPITFFDFTQIQSLPIYHLIAHPADVADAQFIPNSPLPSGYMGSDYLWRGTFVYDGVVYDHIGFRPRGQLYRFATGKNKWKFNFLPGHRLQAKDNYGNSYPVDWDKLNLSGSMQHATRGYRGEHGVFEALAMRIFALAGVPAPATHFVHLRVINGAAEITPNQYEGDFWGLYLAVEEVDRRFQRARDLPDGNLFKMRDWFGSLENQGADQPGDGSDLDAFMRAYSQSRDEAWWRANFDLDGYFRFRSALEAVRHYDVDQGKNYFYYRNPEDGRWSIWPWDADLTWVDRFFGQGNEPFRGRVLPIPSFNMEYQNHLRELRDLLFNPEQIDLLVNEYTDLIDTPIDGASMVDADRAMWDYNPILTSRYVIEERARWGRFYLDSPTKDFRGMMAYIKNWAYSRMGWIDRVLLTDHQAPATPGIAYSGPAGYPADALTFNPGAYADPQGDAFAAVQWRAAQVVWPGLPGYQSGSPNRYEIDSAWTSPVLTQLTSLTLPQGVCMPGFVCRVRLRMMDSTGRWSHWSAPLQFVAGEPVTPPTRNLRITEIMYHPPDRGNVPSKELEFIEFKNTGDQPIELSNWQVRDGIEYTFPIGAKIMPGEFVVLAENPARFRARYNVEAQGEYSGQLSNSGETIELNDAFGRTIVRVTYSDDNGWSPNADGTGPSLVPVDPNAAGDPNLPSSWRASTVAGGSPGADDPAPIVLNEFIFDVASKELRAVELYNPAGYPVDLSGWVLTDRWSKMPDYGHGVGDVAQIPDGTLIAAGGYRLLSLTQLSRAFQFGVGPGAVMVGSVRADGLSSGYAHRAQIHAPAFGESMGRVNVSDGSVVYAPQRSSPAAPNHPPLAAPVTMTKVRLLTDDTGAVQWIELTNRGDAPIPLHDPHDPAATWLIDGLAFWFPPAMTLPPGGRLLVAAGLPSVLCAAAAAPPGWRMTGPLALPAPHGGGTLRLLAPQIDATTGKSTYLLVDEIRVDGVGRLQTAPGATYWQRVADDAFGADRFNWNPASEPLAAGAGIDDGPVGLCSFDVYRNESGAVQIEWVTRSFQPDQRFALWRSMTFDRNVAELVMENIQAVSPDENALFRLTDSAAPAEARPYYWLQLTSAQAEIDVAVAGLRLPISVFFMPVIAQQ